MYKRQALDADVIFLGFWTDKGTCEESLKSFLGALHGKRVELFGTAGFGKDSSYYEKILEAVKAEVPKGNLVGAGYMCQGKMGQRVRKKYEEMLKEDPENRTAQMLIENFDQASSHPDEDVYKRQDCSIAMASGSDAAKNIANVVLLDSNFGAMPHIVNQGRKVVNNIRTAASMFLIKTIFSVCLSLLTIFFGEAYPFEPIQMSLISACAVGIPTFLLAQEFNYERIDKTFLRHVFMNAFPAAVTITACVFVVMLVCQDVYHSNAMLNTACVLVTGWNYIDVYKRQSLDPSHVLLAIGLPHEIAHGSLRLTLSEESTKEDLDYVVEKLKEIVARLRDMSPLYEDFMKKNK